MVARQSDVTNSPEPDANSEPPSAGRAMHAPTLPSARPALPAGAPGRAVFTRITIIIQTEVPKCHRRLVGTQSVSQRSFGHFYSPVKSVPPTRLEEPAGAPGQYAERILATEPGGFYLRNVQYKPKSRIAAGGSPEFTECLLRKMGILHCTYPRFVI